MPGRPDDVRYSGKTGSGRLTAKPSLLTRTGHRSRADRGHFTDRGPFHRSPEL